jgi:hypothetical protein
VVAITVVAVKKIGPAALPVRDEKIEKTVVVVIGPGASGGVAAVVDQASGKNSS